MPVPVIDEKYLIECSPHTFTAAEFENGYMSIIERWYQKDNEGNPYPKPKLKVWDGFSYDKMCENIKKIIKKTPQNNLLDKRFFSNVLKEIKKYKGKKSPNKLKYIKNVQESIELIPKYIDDMILDVIRDSSEIETMTKRDIKSYMDSIERHRKCKEVNRVYKLYEEEYKKPERKDEHVGNPTSY